MMNFAFDLISDLHVESWPDFDWTGQPTSQYCVVAGDAAIERSVLYKTLEHLGSVYSAVFYIDGNEEHKLFSENMTESYQDLCIELPKIPNVVYMQENVVIINGVAILACNGWWDYNFDPCLDSEQSQRWYEDYAKCTSIVSNTITDLSRQDAAYFINSVKRLQTHRDVKSIVLVSHTLPNPWIISHDIDLVDTWRFNSMGNRYMQLCLDQDYDNKISTWCFGHYHKSFERNFNGIRYVSNPRGRGNTPWSQNPYHPKRIEISI